MNYSPGPRQTQMDYAKVIFSQGYRPEPEPHSAASVIAHIILSGIAICGLLALGLTLVSEF